MSIVNITVPPRTDFACTSAKSADSRLGTDKDRLRFWAKVRVQDSDNVCWLWAGSRTSNGRYGQFMWASVYGRMRPVGAHRAAWELTHGPIPAGYHIIHSCDTPLCVNVKHLTVGTAIDNMQDASKKGRLNVPHHRRRRFTDEQVAEMRALCREGRTQQSVADQFGVSKAYVCLLLSGKRRTDPSAAKKRTA